MSATPIRGIRYHNADWPGLGLEVAAMSELWRRASGPHLRRPRRPDFHHLFLCTEGEGHHEVDFQRLEVSPGRVVAVRPGQVHAFGWNTGMEGVILMFAPEVLPAGLPARLPACLRLDEPDRGWVEAAFRDLLAEYGRTDGGAASLRILQHLLAALVLRLERLAGRQAPGSSAAPRCRHLLGLFESEVEQHFLQVREVSDYARRLGYAARTLARATREAGGLSPKAVIQARVLLEAKRLLVHTDLSISRIAVHLGFSEPTNFSKFFRRGAGTSPEGFRSAAGLVSPEPGSPAGSR